MAPSPYIFIRSIGPVDMNKYTRFDKLPSRTLKDIRETKRNGRTDNVKTVETSLKNVKVLIAAILSIILFWEPNSFMHMFNVSALYRESIKMFYQKL